MHRAFALLPALAGIALLSGCDFKFGFYAGPPTGSEITMVPPSDFSSCRMGTRRHQRIDGDGDGRTDTIRVVGENDENEVCRGTDTNADGKIDTWDLMENGRVTRRAHDSDNNGRVDQIWTWPDPTRPSCAVVEKDHDGDGKGDSGKMDLCASHGALPVIAPGPIVPLAASAPGPALTPGPPIQPLNP
jgi:hypothetical protein